MRFCLALAAGLALAGAAGAAGLEDFSARATFVVRADRRTGRLVRAMVAPGVPSRTASGKPIPELVRKTAEVHQVDPLLVHSVIQAESDYNPYALSPKGAQGLMQLMPATARRFGVSNSFSAAENIEGGVRYLKYLMDLFGDEKLAVAAYNAGEQAVLRYQGVPPYPETQGYVRAVSIGYASARRVEAARKAPTKEAGKEAAPVYRPIEQFIDEHGDLHVRTR